MSDIQNVLNNVQKAQSFEDRVFEKIRENIGTLMTDEELKKLLESAMERMFFQDRIIKNNWGQETGRAPGRLYKLVEDLIEPQLKRALVEWMEEHKDEVAKALQAAMDKNLMEAVTKALERMLAGPYDRLRADFQELIDNIQERRG